MKRLFVGGPLDGQWINTGDMPNYHAWKNPKRGNDIVNFGGYENMMFDREIVRYKLMQYVSKEGKVLIYGLETSNSFEVMNELVKGYKRK